MEHRSKAPLPAKLVQGRDSFERWRSRHRPRTRLPEHLWSLATELAGEFGIHRTARALRLDYYGLKKRLQPQTSPESSPTPSASPFLELMPVTASAPRAYCVECRDPGGISMRVDLQGCDMAELTDFCIQLWRRGR